MPDYMKGKGKINVSEIYQIEIESWFKIDMNFSLRKCLKFLDDRGVMIQKTVNNERHFLYYFKIFRMIFNRYSFQSRDDNHKFLQVFFNFVKNSRVLTDNQAYLNDTIFYLLRFVLKSFSMMERRALMGKKLSSILVTNLRILCLFVTTFSRRYHKNLTKTK